MILRGTAFSQVLEMATGITVLVPNKRRPENGYRVAYLLHGLCGNSDCWTDNTMLNVYAADTQTIFVMPEVARSFYTDMQYGLHYFTYIAEELPTICKDVFHISAKREDTAIIGASMGGYGALKCALSYPEQYGFCCAFSSACLFLKEGMENFRTNERVRRDYGERLVSDFKAAFGEELLWQPQNDIMALAKRLSHETPTPKVYACCGIDDYLRMDNRKFRDEMQALPIDFTYEEWAGRHDWAFFNEALRKSLKFCFA